MQKLLRKLLWFLAVVVVIFPPSMLPVFSEGGATRETTRYKVTLTLNSPDELKVKVGQLVVLGQPLSNRIRDQQRLQQQRNKISYELQKLKLPAIKPLPLVLLPELAPLPHESYLEEAARVQRAQTAVDAAQEKYDLQLRKLDLVKTMGDLPDAVLDHEQALLQDAAQNLTTAKSELNFTQGQLSQSREGREYTEYKHTIEVQQRALAIQQQQLEHQRQVQEYEQQERDRGYQVAQLEGQLVEIDNQLSTLATVKSPYTGTVQKIKWRGQHDQNLEVDVVLAIAGQRPPVASPKTSPAPGGPDENSGTTEDGSTPSSDTQDGATTPSPDAAPEQGSSPSPSETKATPTSTSRK